LLALFIYGYCQAYVETRWQRLAHIEVLRQRPVCDQHDTNWAWHVVSLGFIRGVDHHDLECREYLRQVNQMGLPDPFKVLVDYVFGLAFTPIEFFGEHVGVALFHVTKHHNVVLQVAVVVLVGVLVVATCVLQVKFGGWRTVQKPVKAIKQV
jgi:hypothetical protein